MIKLGITSSLRNCQSNFTENYNRKRTSDIKNVKQASDCFEPSSEGKEALKNSKKTEEKYYDLAKIMNIHEKGFHEIPTREESDYYWAARKSNPELDSYLYERDKAEALKFVGEVQSILMKVVSGQPLTPEEEEMVKNDPVLQQEIQIRKNSYPLR
ncbi:hypothetical protein SAMN02745784_02638 [Tissierella praeacuta DSM 18095]|uniref:Uncharacterized protein n=1 Tax=Tissierella praeacuta DSM 18095 TaxID=1123404 RepID=A0A1M4YGZ0_9FIRM|nr:hypothetical protein [Tissierella praeacuta]SHF05000.1 hypothetical protein SAMN02745784_02638 [Tissierella praeacuta DSM 18095]SUP02032.1 Uncharacterised protein [Tissierella praeacuta]